MAVIGPSEYKPMRLTFFRGAADDPASRPTLPSKTQLLAAWQAIEDWWEAGRASLKAQIDAAIGFTTTASMARKLVMAWMLNKVFRGG